ncbi:MAG: pentapeptide repeat-containing protein [Nitrospinota bacterium]|nr:pentapeptide repeat-containing protein [Nitrospinota bacterium]
MVIGLGVLFAVLALDTLKNAGGETIDIWKFLLAPFSLLVSVVVFAAFAFESHRVIEQNPYIIPLHNANLYDAELSRKPKGKLLESSEEYNRWVISADLAGVDLRGADLRNAFLARADLSFADLRGADLARADLYGVDFGCADLRGANFHPYLRHNFKDQDGEQRQLDQPSLRGAIIDEKTIARFDDEAEVKELLARKDEIMKKCDELNGKGESLRRQDKYQLNPQE